MFLVLRLGNINMFVLFVIGLFGVLFLFMFLIVVVLYCSGLLMSKLGCNFCVILVVLCIFFMLLFVFDEFVL